MGSAHKDGHRYDAIVVGSGMGGAIVARELAEADKDVLVLEAGQRETHLGTFSDAIRIYDGNPVTRVPKKSEEGTIIYRTHMAGGSTMVSCGNAVRCLEHELAERGIDLAVDMEAIETEMHVVAMTEDKLSDMGRHVLDAAHQLGYAFGPMPKMIDLTLCQACGTCTLGCTHDAKWTASRPLDQAAAHGAEVLYGISVERVLANGRVRGVAGHGPDGAFEALADTVVLAAGGLGTPPILTASGITGAGDHLFIDTFVDVYGITDEPMRTIEPQMSVVSTEFHNDRGFVMAPFINYPKATRMIEVGPSLASHSLRHTLGMMVKTTDDPVGVVRPDGSVSKPVTPADRARLDDGAAVAAEILVAAGARPDSVMVSKPQGAHPGGTAAIGTVVDTDLQTRMEGLFVADASVLPETPGLPPLVTIGALARRLGRTLATA
ncbi:MAG: FAD-dependent oxidoreductase [Coriobacteriia bacterium]